MGRWQLGLNEGTQREAVRELVLLVSKSDSKPFVGSRVHVPPDTGKGPDLTVIFQTFLFRVKPLPGPAPHRPAQLARCDPPAPSLGRARTRAERG
jgi:hypothetical protein